MPDIKRECVESLFESKFIKVFDLKYAEGKHYYDATRRTADELVACKSDEEFKAMLPDAVTCIVILNTEDGYRLLLSKEYRYPTGRFLLSPPAGLMDPEDREDYANGLSADSALINTAKREISEETGLKVGEDDKIYVVNRLLFSTPGMTDESNGLVCAIINTNGDVELTSEGAVGTECFDGFVLVDEEKAREILKNGRDDDENFYSVYTWSALMYFISGLWK